MAGIKSLMEENPSDYVLNFIQLTSFFENTIGSTDIINIALNYTSDLQGLAETLRKVHPYLTGNSLKNRTTRLEKKILAAVGNQRNQSTNQMSVLNNDKHNTQP